MAPGGSAAQDLVAAKNNFGTFCVKCHGESGKGDGLAASSLSTKPGDLTDCAKMGEVRDEVMFKAIKFGGASVNLNKEMPNFGKGLKDDEINGLVLYVRAFCKK